MRTYEGFSRSLASAKSTKALTLLGCDARLPVYREAWASGDEDFDHDSAYDELVAFLFPEIADKLRTTPW